MSFFKKRTVESITAPITNIVNELKQHAVAQGEEIVAHTNVVIAAQALADAAKIEAQRAIIAADKFAGLVA